MRLCFIWVLIVGVLTGGGVFTGHYTAAATFNEGWAGKSARILSQTPVVGIPDNANTCYGTVLRVTIRSTGDTNACVLGESGKTRLARYLGANYQYAYAVAMGGDSTYTRIDNFCIGLAWCAYSSSADTLLMTIPTIGWRYGTAIIKDFTKYLTRHVFVEPHYTFSYDKPFAPVSMNASIMPTGAVAVSENGKWAIVELLEYGFVRVEMGTGSFRRVVAPGALYGVGADPAFELAISNDGRLAAVAGWGSGLTVYQMDGACGDMLTEGSGRQFAQGVIACQQSAINYHELFPGFVFAEMPRFSGDGMRLSMLILTRISTVRASITPLPPAVAPATPLYVAFGDSFVSGEGEIDDAFYLTGTNTVTNRCHVSSRSYAYLLHPSVNTDTLNKACSGSRTEEVLNQSAQLATSTLSQPLDSISVGVGGNDIDVMGKLKTCISPGTCEWALPDKRLQTAQEIQLLFPKVVYLLKKIQQEYPGVKLFFVGYPKAINDSALASCRLPIAALLNEDERRYMNETVQYLNDILSAAALHTGVPFIDVGDAYIGERLCDTKETAMNGIRTGDDFAPIASLGFIKVIGAESFHPTPRGHELVAGRIREKLATMQFQAPCLTCSNAAILTPPAYWMEGDRTADAAQLIASKFLKDTVVVKNDTVGFSFPEQTFEPNSLVKLELHSVVQMLGEFIADEHGALEGVVKVSSESIGYHAIHALGANVSGEEIDRYEVMFVGEEGTGEVLGARGEVSLVRGKPKGTLGTSSIATAATHGLNVQGATSNTEPKSEIGQVKFGSSQTNWLLIWAIGGAVCMISAILAYSIGRRQV